MENEIIKYLNKNFDAAIPDESNREQLEIFLADRINYLVMNDFNQLVQILYRIDVSEKKLKDLLLQNPGTNAGKMIASLIIDRQIEKNITRRKFRQDDSAIDDNDKWNE